jgi:hypothetical protein
MLDAIWGCSARCPRQAHHGATQLVAMYAGVVLRGVQVLVPEQLLDLAQVRARAEEFCGEHVAQRDVTPAAAA